MSSEITTTLANQINQALAESNRLAESAVVEAARAGKLMIEAKKQVPHGQWSQWIQDNCHMTDRNARRYMQLARELPKLEGNHRAEVMALPIREAVQVIAQSRQVQPVAANQNGHGVSVLSAINTQDGSGQPLSTNKVQPPGLHHRLMQVLSTIIDPARGLGKTLWHYLAKKLGVATATHAQR